VSGVCFHSRYTLLQHSSSSHIVYFTQARTAISGGQQQRVAIVRAIVNRPVVLLADEPTGALDSRTTQEVLDIFGELNVSGITVVMVTHEPEVARQTQRIVWFRDGQVVHSNLTPADLSQLAIS
ncbi:MAG: ATP-binding cassette domain-containing protein, partial [Nostoc sp.]|uniref:ATP-binding cassette domain-containing protein n=1 Tax=Nostoc sp. TaxID=1180 RepID=UPI002FF0E87E